jgi:hypothetical protein
MGANLFRLDIAYELEAHRVFRIPNLPGLQPACILASRTIGSLTLQFAGFVHHTFGEFGYECAFECVLISRRFAVLRNDFSQVVLDFVSVDFAFTNRASPCEPWRNLFGRLPERM